MLSMIDSPPPNSSSFGRGVLITFKKNTAKTSKRTTACTKQRGPGTIRVLKFSEDLKNATIKCDIEGVSSQEKII